MNLSKEHVKIPSLNARLSISGNAFPFVMMLYVTFSVASMMVAYKIVDFGGYIVTGSALIMPFRYLMGDLIAEVYGYSMAKKALWYLIACWYVFSILAITVSQLPSPTYWNHQPAYDFVLGRTLDSITSTLVAIIIGSNLNIYLVSKWKVITKGKYFWLRSIASSGIGELTQYAIALPLMYFRLLPATEIAKLVAFNFTTQLISVIILSAPSTLIVLWVKKIDKIDMYESNLKFNPFRLSVPLNSQKNMFDAPHDSSP